MKYLFGPVNSRRLGFSQGIDLLPPKICSFNCIYCEVGATSLLTCERKEYIPTREIIEELDLLLADRAALDRLEVFTVTASGEPTLHTGIGEIIRFIKEKTAKPVAVLTNGSLLHLAEVRNDLGLADIVIPSLDSAREASYRKINRPASCVPLDQLIDGLRRFSDGFEGDLRLEILLAHGVNDTADDILALKEAVRAIRPARIQLNTVARPPLEAFAAPLTREELKRVAAHFDGPVEILVDFTAEKGRKIRRPAETEIVGMLKRRPCTAADIREALHYDQVALNATLSILEQSGTIRITRHHGQEYYQTKTDAGKP